MPAVRVTEAELDQLFDRLDVWRKADDGRPRSCFLRLLNAAGLAVARVHHIDCPDGRTLRWPSALLVGEVTLFRSGHDSDTGSGRPAP